MKLKQSVKMLSSAAALLAASQSASAGSAFVHLFEWSWNDIAQECETFLGPKGFDAVQISPPSEHVNISQWWARYQPITYQNLTSRSGTEAELQSMINRCHAAGVKIYADIVVNQMANNLDGGNTGIGGTPWSPRNYPEFSPQDFHPSCDTNYGDANSVWSCELYGMPDLDHSLPYVRDTIGAYIKRLSDMGVDGFRIDASKHMPPADIQGFLNAAGNPWVFLEVIGAAGEASQIQPPNYTYLGPVTEMGYGTAVAGNFNGQIKHLLNLGESWGLLPSNDALVFIDNHDRERGHGGNGNLTYHNGAKYNLANVFMLAYPYGYPKVMSSYQFDPNTTAGTDMGPPAPGGCDANGWVCQHRWGNIANMVGFRNYTLDAWSLDNAVTISDNAIAFGRGDKGFVIINNESQSVSETLYTGMPQGSYCDILAGEDECSGTLIQVDASGNATFNVPAESASAIHGGAVPGGNQTPTANISAAPGTEVSVGTQVTLDASGSSDPDGSIVSYQWSTGASSAAISVTPQSAGSTTYTVTVTDNQGATDDESLTISATDGGAASNFEQLYFRGTANSWDTTAMSLVADYTWQTEVYFDGQANQRFKFDVFGDWSYNFGDNGADGTLEQTGGDIFTNVIGHYQVTVNDQQLTYQLQPLDGFSSNWSGVYVRGTFNNWGCTAMTLVDDNTWAASVTLDGQSNQRYKFDRHCDWSDNYGDNNADGSLETNGADIFDASNGVKTLQLNDSELTHTSF
ncbi:alpha amylase C-terminal domain-containing protein [Gilvimarinus xylanilyticus]|uniref:Alpha-amylase n=1 Tax=Gilvimarinus xylanilyticus TaxID=2944139 RepID=A0A9X2KTS5_9GAMM|nr:alpha-amylase family glycosyl hydrolase [Gilvimarinus xylanilyticus]MCP8899098.1 alpha-amylase family glycosyl hydrolase [Gilvimarinus xylanilyticus]